MNIIPPDVYATEIFITTSGGVIRTVVANKPVIYHIVDWDDIEEEGDTAGIAEKGLREDNMDPESKWPRQDYFSAFKAILAEIVEGKLDPQNLPDIETLIQQRLKEKHHA